MWILKLDSVPAAAHGNNNEALPIYHSSCHWDILDPTFILLFIFFIHSEVKTNKDSIYILSKIYARSLALGI